MKGHIFNLLEEFLIEVSDSVTYDDILNQCSFGTEQGFVSTQNYPDEHLHELVEHATNQLGISIAQAHRAFGAWLFPHLLKLVPKGMSDHQHPGDFLRLVDQIHRVELKKLYPDANPPQFRYEGNHESGSLFYSSPRGMFDLVEGVLNGIATYYKSPLSVKMQPINKTDCVFSIKYSQL